MAHFVPVILSGGAGSRLWPVSREALPKPFIKLADGQSLRQMNTESAQEEEDRYSPEAQEFQQRGEWPSDTSEKLLIDVMY